MSANDLEILLNGDSTARSEFLADPVTYMRGKGVVIDPNDHQRVREELVKTFTQRAEVPGSNSGLLVRQ
jgi:hypothetical protein